MPHAGKSLVDDLVGGSFFFPLRHASYFVSEQVLVDLGIHRKISGHAEASMILCGALMRIAAIAFLAERPSLGVGIFCV